MYKKLEDQDLEKVQTAEETPEGECICRCKTTQENDKEPKPESSSAQTQVSVHFDING